MQGNGSLLSTAPDENNGQDPQFHTYLVFIVSKVALRRMDNRCRTACALLMLVSNLVVLCIKKAEKGINLEDFDFLQKLIEYA